MVVRVLQQLRSSGEFQATVPPHAKLKNGGEAILQVKNGAVTSCLILNKDGQKAYHDDDAQRVLLTFGVLDWQLVTAMPSRPAGALSTTARNVLAERSQRRIPQRLKVSEEQYRNWPALERSVYFLADGAHSIEQIAQILSRPEAAIEQIVHNFEAHGVIAR